jgi:branched-chain amino acid transport system substrate-binding protein
LIGVEKIMKNPKYPYEGLNDKIRFMRILLFIAHLVLFLAIYGGCGKPSPPPLLSEWEKLEEEEASILFQKAYDNYQNEQLEKAIQGFEKVYRLYPGAPEGDDAAYLLMLSHYRLKNYDEVLLWSTRLIQEYQETPYRDHAFLFEARIKNRSGDYVEAAIQFGKLLQSTGMSNIHREAESALHSLLHEKMSLPELRELLEKSPSLRPKILLEIGERELEAKKKEEGMETLRNLVEEFPESEEALRAKVLLGSDREKSPRFKIGLLLPFTGEAAPFGRAVNKGAELAMSNNNTSTNGNTRSGNKFEIEVRDSKGDPIVALEKVRELIDEEEVLAIIGPVLSLTTIPVAARANDHEIVLISPTATDERISRIGKYIFQLNPSMRIHGRTMAHFAIEKFGFTHFALLYPSDGYGEEMVKVFSEEVERLGGKILAREDYPLGTTDFQKMILRLKRTEPEAIFIPAHPEEVLLIAPQLRFHNVEATILGGTGWGPDKVVESKYAEGSFFPYNPFEGEEEPENGSSFANLFRETYGVNPSHSAALGYDAVQILKKVIGKGWGKVNSEIIRERLSSMESYSGVSGILSLTRDLDSDGSVWTIVKGRRIRVEEIEESPGYEIKDEENNDDEVPIKNPGY